MQRTTASIPEEYLKLIDKMVELGLYDNRAEAIEDAVKRLITKRKRALIIREEAFSKIKYY